MTQILDLPLQRIAKAIRFFFSFDAPSSKTLSSPSLFSSSMPPPESGTTLIPVGLAFFNRRVTQLVLASKGECDRERAGSSLVEFEGTFFSYFQKKVRVRATRNEENYKSGIIGKKMYRLLLRRFTPN